MASATGLAWLRETMYGLYFAYYPLLLLIPALIMITRRATVRDVLLRCSATYLVCFTIYAVMPVIGPRATLVRLATEAPGFLELLNHGVHAAGDAVGTAFPSSHVAGSLLAAWLAWRYLGRRVARFTAVLAGGVTLATIYTQNHYVVDVAAAFLVTGFAMMVLVPAIERVPEYYRVGPPARRRIPIPEPEPV